MTSTHPFADVIRRDLFRTPESAPPDTVAADIAHVVNAYHAGDECIRDAAGSMLLERMPCGTAIESWPVTAGLATHPHGASNVQLMDALECELRRDGYRVVEVVARVRRWQR